MMKCNESKNVDEIDDDDSLNKNLFALVIVPTRELAIQVNTEIERLCVHTEDPKLVSITLVGGLSLQKQQRLLKVKPDVIVATPGRLWAHIQESNEHLEDLSQLKMLVIDEIDRMMEKGHFEELSFIIEHIHKNRDDRRANTEVFLQTLLFSATLTFTNASTFESSGKSQKVVHKIQQLVEMARLRPKKYVIADLSKTTATPETLIECRMNCINLMQKDANLYYLLNRYGGRTLVFTNSIDAARRIYGVLNKLRFKPCPLMLHAKMTEQKRLKNLEKFIELDNSVLLATDVAARGLDIKGVDNVVHYQVPRTPENYVHRSGRTARASNSGISVLLIDPLDVHFYRRICKNLNKHEDLDLLSVDSPNLMEVCLKRVSLAADAESLEFSCKKIKSKKDWFHRMAKEADLILDEEQNMDDADNNDQSMEVSLKRRKKQLESALKRALDQQMPKTKGQNAKIDQNAGASVKTKVSVSLKNEQMRSRFKLERGLHKLYKKGSKTN